MFALLTTTLAAAAAITSDNSLLEDAASHPPRSNATHIAWRIDDSSSSPLSSSSTFMRTGSKDTPVTWQTIKDAKQDAYYYLRENVMAFDLPFLETLGFHDDRKQSPDDDDDDVDGLADGLIGPAIELALQAKIQFAYTDALPKHIWLEYVLNYANLNEARNNIRPLLWERVVVPLFGVNNTTTVVTNDISNNNEVRTIPETVRILNTEMWKLLAPAGKESLVFVGGQTPAIFDPMSVLAFGYASCTGFAILFVQALRAAGIPARVAGTAAWNGDRDKGNHNWVEVWTGMMKSSSSSSHVCDCAGGGSNGINENDVKSTIVSDCQCGWSFLEPSPGQDNVDTLDRNPCERWFCQPDRFPGTGGIVNRTRAFAARGWLQADTHFPLAWEWDSRDVPGVDRTEYYEKICSKCSSNDDSTASSIA